MRCHLGHGPVKCIVKAGKMRRRGKDRLRGGDECQRHWDVQRREVHGSAQLVEDLWRNELMGAELGPSVHDAMADGHGRGVNMLLDCRAESGKGITLGLEEVFAPYQRSSVGRTNM